MVDLTANGGAAYCAQLEIRVQIVPAAALQLADAHADKLGHFAERQRAGRAVVSNQAEVVAVPLPHIGWPGQVVEMHAKQPVVRPIVAVAAVQPRLQLRAHAVPPLPDVWQSIKDP